ncbi:MAG: hypothetical protein KDJ51_05845, partial [Nitratireductor sp.]|nr:hypothetical protein [Nitratireductor sp.]
MSFSLLLLCFLGAFQPVSVRAADDEDVAATREAATLDSLFGDLARQSDARKAGRIAQQIVGKLNDSGSDTINLLMEWSARALREKNN